MADFKKVTIDIMENGYVVTVCTPKAFEGKKFVFDTVKKLQEWLKENLSVTGEVERFSDALDDDDKNDTIDGV